MRQALKLPASECARWFVEVKLNYFSDDEYIVGVIYRYCTPRVGASGAEGASALPKVWICQKIREKNLRYIF